MRQKMPTTEDAESAECLFSERPPDDGEAKQHALTSLASPRPCWGTEGGWARHRRALSVVSLISVSSVVRFCTACLVLIPCLSGASRFDAICQGATSCATLA